MKYRKKPVIIDAIKLESFSEYDVRKVLKFMHQTVGDDRITQEKFSEYCFNCERKGVLPIDTLEGVINASVGDYIIRGVEGEYYPCKPDIFDKTYELAE